MGQNLIVTGMVLAAIPIGDYDKRITLLTREQGKITAFVRGARRQNSSMLAAGNPFAFGEFEIYQGRNTYNVAKASISSYFRELTEHYEMVCLGYYFLEVAEYYAQENADEAERLKLLYQTLRALASGRFSRRLIKNIYELKTMTINGEYPHVFSCLRCKAEEGLTHFSMRLQGCVCKDCQKEAGGNPIEPSLLYAMQFVIATPVEKLFTFVLSPQIEGGLDALLTAYRRNYQGHVFKSEEFLEL